MMFLSKNKGFSLIETVVYITVFSSLLFVVVNMFLLMSGAYKRIKISQDINDSAVFIMERLTRETRQASDASVGTDLVLTSFVDESASTATFSIENGGLVLQKDSVDLGVLNKSDVTVSGVSFILVDSGVSKILKVNMTLSAGAGDESKSETFYNSIVLRGAY